MADAEPAAATPEPKPRRWWQSEPMDEQGSRTMFVGLIIAFAFYGVSFVVPILYDERAWAQWVSMGLILSSVIFLAIWFLAVRRGFRMGKQKSRAERRAAMHAKAEKEKRIRLNR